MEGDVWEMTSITADEFRALPQRKKHNKFDEHTMQKAVFDWAISQRQKYPFLERLFFAVPNAIGTTPRLGSWLKQEGKKKGVSDTLLLVERGPFNGMCMEFKLPDMKLRPEQVAFLLAVKEQGYYTFVAYSSSSGIEAIEKYLNCEGNMEWLTANEFQK